MVDADRNLATGVICMPENGIDEMEKRAELVSTRWKVIAWLAAGVTLVSLLAAGAAALFRSKSGD